MIKKKKLWAITDGSQGMISQVNGLAYYLNKNFTEKKCVVKWPWSFFQPGFIPIFKNIFNKDLFKSYPPHIIITCGRKSVYASLYLKKILRKKLISIHIQNPKVNFKNFDFVISPNHDKISGKNIINSVGALNHINKIIINKTKTLFKVPQNKKKVLIILGGENNHYNFNETILKKLILKIKGLLSKKNNYFFIFVSSRRTDKNFINIINKQLKKNIYVWDNKTNNPYLFSLKIADYIIVTSDSTSMISEACSTGKPVFIFHLPFKRKSLRFEYFHREFEKKGFTRPFKNKLYTWKYKPLNESKRIARILTTRILKENNE